MGRNSVAAVLLAFLASGAYGAPVQIIVEHCPRYAMDGRTAVQMRKDGRTKEMIVEYWKERRNRFTDEQWPIAMHMLERAFTTDLGPEQFELLLLAECVDRGGWLFDGPVAAPAEESI